MASSNTQLVIPNVSNLINANLSIVMEIARCSIYLGKGILVFKALSDVHNSLHKMQKGRLI